MRRKHLGWQRCSSAHVQRGDAAGWIDTASPNSVMTIPQPKGPARGSEWLRVTTSRKSPAKGRRPRSQASVSTPTLTSNLMQWMRSVKATGGAGSPAILRGAHFAMNAAASCSRARTATDASTWATSSSRRRTAACWSPAGGGRRDPRRCRRTACRVPGDATGRWSTGHTDLRRLPRPRTHIARGDSP